MRSKLIAGFVVALVVPSLALAAKPSPPGKSHAQHGKAAPQVMYVLKGVLSSYTAATDSANGSISILVEHANRHGRALTSLTTPLTFVVTTKTRVRISNQRTFADGDIGIVKVRALKTRTTDAATLATMLQSQPAAFQVIDQHAASSS